VHGSHVHFKAQQTLPDSGLTWYSV